MTSSITHVIEDVRDKLRDLTAYGGTALWDALHLAQRLLVDYSRQYPGSRKRIIALTDGNNTVGKHEAHTVCFELEVHLCCNSVSLKPQSSDIVVDSIIIGRAENKQLEGVSTA